MLKDIHWGNSAATHVKLSKEIPGFLWIALKIFWMEILKEILKKIHAANSKTIKKSKVEPIRKQ